MKRSTLLLLVLSAVMGASAKPRQGAPQRVDRSHEGVQPVGRVEAAKHQLQLDPPIGPRAQKLDPVKLRQEADELSTLAQSVPAAIAQVSQGKLPKDMAEKLKRIEKLSKHLRGELTQ
jgi:hypothetical protein